jgi:NAD-dependent dihydropyrimidine dehydrogenase PreA subunit
MVTVRYEDCTGCGDCIPVCPNNAIFLQNEVAVIDQTECGECCTCVETCQEGAIMSVEQEPQILTTVTVQEELPAVRQPSAEMIPTQPIQTLAIPAIGSVLLWTGREILPRLANAVFQVLDRKGGNARKLKESAESSTYIQRSSRNSKGMRHRQRQRRKRRYNL